MLNVDPDQICSAYLAANPAMSPNAQSGLLSILSGMAEDLDLSDPRWAAYMLATVKHECANHWQPIEEFGKVRAGPMANPLRYKMLTVPRTPTFITVADTSSSPGS